MKKRLVSMGLILCMAFSLLPMETIPASAADDYPSNLRNAAKDSLIDPWRFYNRECTSFVAWCLNDRNGVAFTNSYGGVTWGNASNWGYAAKKIGITVDNTPAVGAVAWQSSGHVAWVAGVEGSNVNIEEYNYNTDGKYHNRTLPISSYTGFIHIKDITSTPEPVPVSVPTAPRVNDPSEYYTTKDSPTISWNAVSGADEYSYYLTEYPEGYAYTTNTKSGTIGNTSITFNGLRSGKYTLFVHANNSAGRSEQSNWVSFTVVEEDYLPTEVKAYNGHIYALYDYEASWSFSKELSEYMGGHLLTITSRDEEAFIEKLISGGKKEAYWLGAYDFDPNKITVPYRWVTGEAFSYTNWRAGEPSSSGQDGEMEHFAEIRKSYDNQWNDVNNINKANKGFIVEIEPSDSYITARETFNGHEYLIIDKNTTWTEAKAYCELLGGQLVSVNSAAEQDFIYSLVKRGKRSWYFLGASRPSSSSNTWTWVDGTSGNYINWTDGASKWTGNYLMVYKDKSNSVRFNNVYYPTKDIKHIGFVCEIEKADETITEPDTSLVTDPTIEPVPTTNPAIDPDAEPITEPIIEPTTDLGQTVPEVHFPRQTVYNQGQFEDVKANQWFTATVGEAFAFGLMKGNSDNTFNPYGDVTIAEAITMAARIHSIYTSGTENFAQRGKWYQVYLDYAYENGVIPYAYYNSDVSQKATRAQFAEIFANALPEEGLYAMNNIGDNAVPDVPMTASYAQSVYKLYRAGILSGGDVKGTFSPDSFITRAESAAIVSRMAESNNRVDFTLN